MRGEKIEDLPKESSFTLTTCVVVQFHSRRFYQVEIMPRTRALQMLLPRFGARLYNTGPVRVISRFPRPSPLVSLLLSEQVSAMFRSSIRVVAILVTIQCGFSSGCSYFPEFLQPHELQKLNRGPGPSTDPFYSSKMNPASIKIIPTSFDRPAIVNDRPQFRGTEQIDP